jgi:hypothetical protein
VKGAKMNKPNIFWHMMGWGFVSGSISFYLLIAWPISNGTYWDFVPILDLQIWIIGLAIILGGVTSSILSIFTALAIRYELWRSTKIAAQSIYATVFLINSIITLMLLIFVFSLDMPLLLYIVPSLSFILLGTYAAHRYLDRLQRYYEQGGKEKRKSKPKHDMNRLEDKENIEEASIIEVENDSRQRQEG